MRIYINNTWQEFDILKAPPIKTSIDDSLDTATIIFYADFEEPIEKNTFVEIQDTIMCVYNDQSVPISKYNNKWQHTLSLIETTYLLDQVPCNNICLTNSYDTFYTKLKKMSANIAFFAGVEFDEDNFLYNLSGKLITAIQEVNTSPEIYCLNLTAKECYNEILKTINARIELKVILSNENNIKYILDYRSGSKRNNLVSFKKMSTLNTYDSNNMTNNITYMGKNAVTRYPITQGFEGFKTTDPTLTTENAMMVLNYEIEDIVSFIVLAEGTTNITIKVNDDDVGQSFYRTFVLELDLTNNLIEQEAYNLLNSFDQEWKIPYTKNNIISTGKMGLLHSIALGGSSKIENIVYNELYGKLDNEVFVKELIKDDTTLPSGFVVTSSVPSEIKSKINEIAYKITYYPFLNVYGKITKNAKKQTNLSIIDQQQEEVLSLERYSDYLEDKLKRIGNNEIEIDEVNQPIKQLNDYTEDGYVIYEREIAQSTNEVKVHYKLSKDYNLLNSRLAVDQKKRLFEIPLDYQDCYLTPKYTMVASTKLITNEDRAKRYMDFFSTNLKIACVSTLIGKVISSSLVNFTPSLDLSIRGIWFKTTKGSAFESIKYISCGTYAFQNSLHFLALTYDNYSSALSIGGQVLGGKKALYNPYVNDDGEFDKINLALCIKNNTSKIENLISYPNESAAGQKGTKEKEIYFYKDRVQRICFDISAEIRSIDEDIQFGKEFYQNNLLLQNVEIPTLYLWYSTTQEYEKSPRKASGQMLEQDITTLFDVSYYVEDIDNYVRLQYIGEEISNVKSWSIADNNGNIYIAVNGEIRPIYFT